MLKVKVRNGNIDGALKILKRKVRNVKQINKLRENQQFDKPSVGNREEKRNAIYLEKKRLEEGDD